MIKEGCTGLLIFLDIRSVTVFKGLNFTNQASAHLTIFFKICIKNFCRNVWIIDNYEKTGIVSKKTYARSDFSYYIIYENYEKKSS